MTNARQNEWNDNAATVTLSCGTTLPAHEWALLQHDEHFDGGEPAHQVAREKYGQPAIS